jgi:hypothetical protein|tara:strand:- start:78 stop:287 length:210 start_codon:yes stop_codon:yes gene_type:complete
MPEERNELTEPVTNIVDHGDLQGNPVPTKKEQVLKGPQVELDLNLTDEEEEMLKAKLEAIRKSDPFIYR